jgi:hypothetical protein
LPEGFFFSAAAIAVEKRKFTHTLSFPAIARLDLAPGVSGANILVSPALSPPPAMRFVPRKIEQAPRTARQMPAKERTVMSCRCLLCGMERHLTKQFAGCAGWESYREFAAFSSALSTFPAASDLISYLHTEQSAGNGTSSKDGILAELLRGARGNGRSTTAQELLLWAFVPMLHRISRQVLTRSPALAPDDVGQHVVTALLESFGSPELAGRDSHLAFATARLLRRNAFAWAERETRGTMLGLSGNDALERTPHGEGPQPIERGALLLHFLERCRRRGILSREDLELLVQFKLDGLPSAEYSNASRQRMKRLLAKLRRAARRPRRTKIDERQLRLF